MRLMTRQEVFDTVARHLAAQGYRAGYAQYHGPTDHADAFKEFTCQYRTRQGDRCAIGCILPDAAYNCGMEGYRAGSSKVLPALPVKASDATFVSALQYIHDDAANWETPDYMVEALFNFAESNRLDPAILDRLDFGLIIPNRLDT